MMLVDKMRSLTEEDLGPVAFVPLVGDQGW